MVHINTVNIDTYNTNINIKIHKFYVVNSKYITFVWIKFTK